ncbi:hypothetical protein D3C87_1620560 [compost metagenome]
MGGVGGGDFKSFFKTRLNGSQAGSGLANKSSRIGRALPSPLFLPAKSFTGLEVICPSPVPPSDAKKKLKPVSVLIFFSKNRGSIGSRILAKHFIARFTE